MSEKTETETAARAIKAVENEKEMYAWLANNPSKKAVDYLKLKGFTEETTPYDNSFLCDFIYNKEANSIDCKKCLLKGMWHRKADKFCFNRTAAFFNYHSASDAGIKFAYALEIVALCDEWLSEHSK